MRKDIYIILNNVTDRECLEKYFTSKSHKVELFSSEHLFVQKISKIMDKENIVVISSRDIISTLKKENLSMVYIEFLKSEKESDLMTRVNRSRIETSNTSIGNSSKFDILLIGSSTGGFPVVKSILEKIDPKKTAVIICQHVNASHSEQLLETLQEIPHLRLKVATITTKIENGFSYILDGGKDFSIVDKYGDLSLVVNSDLDGFYHPSYNALLSSALNITNKIMGSIILSGLGDDGSKAIFAVNKLTNSNLELIAQDPKEAIAPGMPTSAIATGNINKVLNTEQIINYLTRRVA